MSQLQVTGEAKIRDIQGPVVANSGVITALDGAASQYVRGDGTLADFPTSSGGGSSVSYYLNSSVSQGTIGGVAYRELSKDPIIGAGTDIAISSNGYVASYITDANDPDVTIVPGGNFNCEFYFSVNNNTGNPFTYAELYKYDGTTFTLLGSSVGVPEYINQGTIIAPYYFAIPVPTSALALTDRLAIRIYVNVDGRTVTLHTENSHLCQVVTTLSKGMVSLNNLTDQSQFLTTGTSGTNFSIASSGDTHTFNLPVASATNTGKLSSTDWSTFNNKQNALTNPITGLGASGNVAYFDSASSITSENSFNYDASTNRLGVNTTVPNATIGANAGTDSGYSLLLKNDNANYNGIGFGTDSTYGNLISTEKQGTALTRNLTLLNQSGFVSLTEAGNLGLGLLTPNTGLDIYNGTSAYLWLHTATSGTSGTDGVRLALFNTNGANLRNFEGSFSITAEGDFSVITLGAENFKINSADGSIYQSKVANAMLKTVSGVLTAAVAGTDYLAPSAISGTTNTVAKFASSSTIGNSNITDTGSLITLGSTTNISSGNFGVGTSSPAVAGVGIDIYSATSAGLRFHTATSGTTVSDGAGINFSAANNLGITNYEAGAIDIVTNGNSGVYINQLGYVGINGATPSSELTVNGNAAISGLTTGQIVFPTTGGLLIGSSSLFWDNTNGRLAVGTNNTSTGRKLTIYSASADTHLAILGAAPSVRFADNFTATYSTLFGMATASNNYVTGAVAGDFVITYNSSNNLIFGNSNTSLEKMRINSSGNLLINTTNDNGANLNVNGVIYGTRARLNNSYDNSSVSLNVGGQTYMDSRTSRLYQTYNLSSMSNYMHIYDPYSSVNANGGFSIGASSSITTLPSTSIIHFDGVNNRVGIGTTAPSAALSVVGAATFTGGLSGTSATFSGIITGSRNDSGNVSATLANAYLNQGNLLNFQQNNGGSTLNAYIGHGGDNTGNFIIVNNGITPLTLAKSTGAATFSSSVTAGGVSYISGNSNTGPIPYLQFTDNYGSAGRNWALINGYDNYGTLSFKVSTAIGGNPYSGTSVLSMTQGGNVGIGTSSPSRLLNISGSGTDGTQVQINGTVDSAGIKFIPVTGDNWEIQANTSNQFFVYNRTDSAYRFLIDGSGNVGIGTSSPSEILQANGNIRALQTSNDGISQLIADASNTTGYRVGLATFGNTASGTLIGIGRAANSFLYKIGGTLAIGTENAYPLIFSTTDTERMRITSGGDVCIASTAPVSTRRELRIGGNAAGSRISLGLNGTNYSALVTDSGGNVYLANEYNDSNIKLLMINYNNGVYLSQSATSWTANSDERLKDINGTIENAVDKLKTLRAVNFSWKSDENKKEVLGLIAQDVEKVFPQVIDKNKLVNQKTELKDETEYLGVRYVELVPVLIKAIQEQQAQIEELKALIAAK